MRGFARVSHKTDAFPVPLEHSVGRGRAVAWRATRKVRSVDSDGTSWQAGGGEAEADGDMVADMEANEEGGGE